MAYQTTLALSFLAPLLLYTLYTRLHQHLTNSAFKAQHACKPPPFLPGSGLLGFSVLKSIVASHKGHTFLSLTTQKFREIGPTWAVSYLNRTLIMTVDPANIKALLSTHFADFSLGSRLAVFAPLLTGGIFVSDGAQWQHSRSLVRPAFTRAQVADLESFEPHVQQLIRQIPGDGRTVDLMPLFYRLTLDQATEFLLGESVNSLSSAEGSAQQRFGAAFDYAQTKLGSLNSAGVGAWLWPNRRFIEAVGFAHAFVDEFVRKARKERASDDGKEKEKMGGDKDDEEEGKQGRYVFLNELAKATDDPIQMRNEILNVLLAGRDTTASMLTSTFHALSLRADIWTKLRAEVAPLEGKPPDNETLRNMKYLRNVQNEMLRLYPAVPSNSRLAVRNTFLPRGGGPDGKSPVFVAKGQQVVYTPYAMHRLHPTFNTADDATAGDNGDACEVKPERWDAIRPTWEFLPFNGGPRICVGQQFALTEWGYAVVRLVQAFEGVESRDPEPWTESLSLTVSSANGAKVAFKSCG